MNSTWKTPRSGSSGGIKKRKPSDWVAFLFKKRKLELNYKFIRKAFHNASMCNTKTVPNFLKGTNSYFTSIFLQ